MRRYAVIYADPPWRYDNGTPEPSLAERAAARRASRESAAAEGVDLP